jgi:hypothetical protein
MVANIKRERADVGGANLGIPGSDRPRQARALNEVLIRHRAKHTSCGK